MLTRSDSEQFLLNCLNGPDPETRDRIARFNDAEWQALMDVAYRHAVIPLLHSRLTRAATPVPEDILQELRDGFLKNGTRNLLIYRDLEQILRGFQAENIPVIVLKGAHLAALVYEDPALRPMADIDLLVPQADLPRAAARLKSLGYSFEGVAGHDIPAWVEAASHTSHLPPFFKPPHPRIEMHWRIDAAQPRQSLPELWRRARTESIAGVATRVLAPEDLLLHLCLHGVSHHAFGQGLQPLYDIRFTLEHHTGGIDWERFISMVREWRAEKCVYLALRMAREITGAPVPDPVMQTLEPPDFDARWLAVARERLFEVEEALEMDLVPMMTISNLANLFRPDGTGCGLRSRLRLLFPSRNHMAQYMAARHALPLTRARRYTSYGTRAMDFLGKSARLVRFWLGHRREVSRCIHDQHNKALLETWLK